MVKDHKELNGSKTPPATPTSQFSFENKYILIQAIGQSLFNYKRQTNSSLNKHSIEQVLYDFLLNSYSIRSPVSFSRISRDKISSKSNSLTNWYNQLEQYMNLELTEKDRRDKNCLRNKMSKFFNCSTGTAIQSRWRNCNLQFWDLLRFYYPQNKLHTINIMSTPVVRKPSERDEYIIKKQLESYFKMEFEAQRNLLSNRILNKINWKSFMEILWKKLVVYEKMIDKQKEIYLRMDSTDNLKYEVQAQTFIKQMAEFNKKINLALQYANCHYILSNNSNNLDGNHSSFQTQVQLGQSQKFDTPQPKEEAGVRGIVQENGGNKQTTNSKSTQAGSEQIAVLKPQSRGMRIKSFDEEENIISGEKYKHQIHHDICEEDHGPRNNKEATPQFHSQSLFNTDASQDFEDTVHKHLKLPEFLKQSSLIHENSGEYSNNYDYQHFNTKNEEECPFFIIDSSPSSIPSKNVMF